MIVVGAMMLREREANQDADVRLTTETAKELLPLLLGIGFVVGVFSGFFGIGGGFLIVPGLILATGMPLTSAIGTSLVAITAFGAATAASYAWSGLVDWPVAALFVLGGLAGGVAGVRIGLALAERKRTLNVVFAGFVIAVGIYITSSRADGSPATLARQGEEDGRRYLEIPLDTLGNAPWLIELVQMTVPSPTRRANGTAVRGKR